MPRPGRDAQARVVTVERARQRRRRHHAVARGDDVRLGEAVVPRRPARAEAGDGVVGPRGAVERIGRADGNRRPRVAGAHDPAVAARVLVRVLAAVAGRHHDHDARAHGALNGLHQRIGGRRLEDRVAKRHVDDADVEVLPVRNGVLDRAQHVRRRPGPVGVEHLEADEADVRGHAAEDARGCRAVAADEPGHVRAVAVVVVRRGHQVNGPLREVDEPDDPGRGQFHAGLDARVDDRHAERRETRRKHGPAERTHDAAVELEVAVVAVPRGGHGSVERDRLDPRLPRQSFDRLRRQLQAERVDHTMLAAELDAAVLQQRGLGHLGPGHEPDDDAGRAEAAVDGSFDPTVRLGDAPVRARRRHGGVHREHREQGHGHPQPSLEHHSSRMREPITAGLWTGKLRRP